MTADPALNRVLIGDCRNTLATLPERTFQCCVTSPPYWGLRDYGHPEQLGMESTPEEYVTALVGVFGEVRRVLRDDGTLWLNLGDSYVGASGGGQGKNGQVVDRAASRMGVRDSKISKTCTAGLKAKDLVGIPWRVAFALQADGWYLRSDVIWAKPNPMPESVHDRPTKAHEYVFLLAKSARYFYDADAIREPAIHAGRVVRATDAQTAKNGQEGVFGATSFGFTQHDTEVGDRRNARTVWTIASAPYDGAHFATMPPKLAERCIAAGSRLGSAVLDPFMGSGTVGMVAESLGRRWLGCELSGEYETLIHERTAQTGLPFAEAT